jgi:hypothetical protein
MPRQAPKLERSGHCSACLVPHSISRGGVVNVDIQPTTLPLPLPICQSSGGWQATVGSARRAELSPAPPPSSECSPRLICTASQPHYQPIHQRRPPLPLTRGPLPQTAAPPPLPLPRRPAAHHMPRPLCFSRRTPYRTFCHPSGGVSEDPRLKTETGPPGVVCVQGTRNRGRLSVGLCVVNNQFKLRARASLSAPRPPVPLRC